MIRSIQPSREVIARAQPDPWLRNGEPTQDFYESMPNVSATYIDPVVDVAFYPELFFDGLSQLAIDPSGNLLTVNSARGLDHVPVRQHVERIQELIREGKVEALETDCPLAILSTSRHSNYYHCLFDDVARVSFYADLPVRFVVASPRKWQEQIYRLAGIEDRLLLLERRLFQLRNVWLAPRGLGKIHDIRSRSFDFVTSLCDPPVLPPLRKLYVTRDHADHRRLLNETEVQAVLAHHGFEVVRPELLPVADQMQLFAQASIVIGVFGAGLTNIAFMAPGARVLEIAPPTEQRASVHNVIFATLCGLRRLNYGLVSGKDIMPESHDFTLPLSWLERLLDYHIVPGTTASTGAMLS